MNVNAMILSNASKIQALNEAIIAVGDNLPALITHYCEEYEYSRDSALDEIKATYCMLIKTLN